MRFLTTVRGRLAAVFIMVAALGVGGVAVVASWQRDALEESAKHWVGVRSEESRRVFEVIGSPLATFARDDTRWDDFVAFLEGNEPDFVDEQLAPGMETFEVDRAWVLDAAFSVVHAEGDLEEGETEALPVPSAALAELLGGGEWFRHFFAASGGKVLEVRTAPIQPDADLKRSTPPKGYLLVARRLNPERLEQLGLLTTSQVRLVAATGPAPVERVGEGGVITIVRPLAGRDGTPVAHLVGESPLAGRPELEQGLRRQLVLFGALSAVTLALLVGALSLWVARPLGRIRRALDGDRPEPLAAVAADRSEFGAVARSLRRYFEQQEELKQRAQFDSLTGLPSRSLTEDRLRVALEQARRYGRIAGILMLDLDGFKSVNDAMGHDAGDAVLKEVGARLLTIVRASDTVGRLGGDEFVVVLSEVSGAADAEIVARRIVEAIGAPYFLDHHDARLGCSVGIALYPSDGRSAEELLRRADEAMYRAKKRGKGCFALASEEAADGAGERAAFLADLRAALERGTVGVRYLPRVDLASEAIVGGEAVVHWERGEGRVFPAADLQRLAEETGLIVPLEEFVLRAVCADLGRRRAAGRVPGVVSVRASARRLLRPSGVDELLRIARAADAPPEALEVRVAESAVAQHRTSAVAAVDKLVRAGVRVALDEFGLGAASLNLIRELPIDAVVFASAFVEALEEGSDRAALFSAVAGLSKMLSRPRIVAAGVNDPATLALVRSVGGHAAQGRAVGEPLDADAFADRLDRRSAEA